MRHLLKKENNRAEELFDDALGTLKAGKPLEGGDGILTPLIIHLFEASHEREMDAHFDERRP